MEKKENFLRFFFSSQVTAPMFSTLRKLGKARLRCRRANHLGLLQFPWLFTHREKVQSNNEELTRRGVGEAVAAAAQRR